MKRVFAVILSFAMLAALAVSAGAEPAFLHPFTRVDDSALYLAGPPAEEGTITVTVNGQSFSHYTLTTVEEAELPITYYCVVDQSSSLSNSQRKQQLQALTALSDAMRPVDRMVLVLMGEEVSFGEPLTTREEREQAIEEACVYSARSTSLNAAIVTVMQTAAAARDDESLGCILLITDGLDDALVRVSQEEAEQAIRSSGLSLCTLAVVAPWDSRFSQNNATHMAEYAEQSIGGFSVIPSRNNFESPTCVEDALNEVVTHVLSGSVLSLDLSQLPATEGTLEIQVAWQQGDTRLTDTCTVDAALLPAPTEPETTPPETTEPETTPPETTEPETTPPEMTEPTQPETTQSVETTPPVQTRAASASIGSSQLILIFLVAGFALLVILIILAVVLRRKQRSLEEPEPNPKKESCWTKAAPDTLEGEDWYNLDISELTVQKNSPEPQKESVQTSLAPPPKQEQPKKDTTPGCKVRLVPDFHPEGSMEFTIGVNESVTLGRNKRSNIILSETDTALSGLHFELQWDSRVLYLRDRKSTNGTALNSVPLRPEVWVRVENRATIQAGSDRYTVFVEKK